MKEDKEEGRVKGKEDRRKEGTVVVVQQKEKDRRKEGIVMVG